VSIISERRKSKAETQPTVSKTRPTRRRPIERALLHGRLLRVKAKLDQIADARGGDPGICNGPKPDSCSAARKPYSITSPASRCEAIDHSM
jgi:hypothetical protein